MKKFKKLLPWIVAGGAIALAVSTHRFYANKILLEIPTFKLNGQMKMLLPSMDAPMIYELKTGEQLALYAVKSVEAAVTKAV